MCEPKSRQFIGNFIPASIENLDVEGKQKARTPTPAEETHRPRRLRHHPVPHRADAVNLQRSSAPALAPF
jgi:hypothetical protein